MAIWMRNWKHVRDAWTHSIAVLACAALGMISDRKRRIICSDLSQQADQIRASIVGRIADRRHCSHRGACLVVAT